MLKTADLLIFLLPSISDDKQSGSLSSQQNKASRSNNRDELLDKKNMQQSGHKRVETTFNFFYPSNTFFNKVILTVVQNSVLVLAKELCRSRWLQVGAALLLLF